MQWVGGGAELNSGKEAVQETRSKAGLPSATRPTSAAALTNEITDRGASVDCRKGKVNPNDVCFRGTAGPPRSGSSPSVGGHRAGEEAASVRRVQISDLGGGSPGTLCLLTPQSQSPPTKLGSRVVCDFRPPSSIYVLRTLKYLPPVGLPPTDLERAGRKGRASV